MNLGLFSQAVAQLQKLANESIKLLPNIAVAVIVFILFYFASKWVRIFVKRFFDRYKQQKNLGLVLGRLTRWFIILLGFLISAVIVFPGFTPVQLIQLLGIGSVAVGFAFRDIFQNFLAGILLLLTEPFRVGDQIVIKDFEGTVEEIQTRATMIKTYDGRRIVIPNADLFSNSVVVNTAFNKRRVEYDIGIGSSDNIDKAKKLILEAIQNLNDILPDPPPDVIVTEIGDYNVSLRVRWWVKPPRYSNALDTRDQVLAAIKEKLLTNGIDLPFPTQQILFHDQTEETDGDRTRQREGWPTGKDAVPQPYNIARTIKNVTDTIIQGKDTNHTQKREDEK